ncbi:MAG: hypothetical protein ABSG46_16375 [Candidatus Binataceae bacterium]
MKARPISGIAALAIAFCLALAPYLPALADATAASAAQLSDSAFSLLNSVNSAGGKTAAALAGPVATLAADAQSLSQSLASGDRAGASQQMAALIADRIAVENAIRQSGSVPGWDPIEHQLDALAKTIPPSAPAAAAPSTAAVPPPPITAERTTASTPTIPSAAPAVPSAPSASIPGPMPAESSFGSPPKAVIESRSDDGGMLRVKGYLEGTALVNAGIYLDGQLLKPIRLTPVEGEQRLDFDLGLGSAGPGTSIRVYDSHGRSAEVFASAPEAGPAVPDIGNSAASDRGVEVDRGPHTAPGETAATGTAEIPSHGVTRRSPSKRHTIQSHLGDIQIDVVTLRQIAVTPPMYEVIGVIEGSGVTSAGIYIDGRLAAPIPSSSGATITNLDQRFVMDGHEASIRAFGGGSHYTEHPIDLATAVAVASPPPLNPPLIGGPPASAPSAMLGGGTISIQLTEVAQISAAETLVSGIIAGRNLRSAGLYQNSMLVQSINVTGGGVLGSLLSKFTPQTVKFTERFNPQAGPAVIRVADGSGTYTEQPVVAGGVNAYMAPAYGAPPASTNLYGGAPAASGW